MHPKENEDYLDWLSTFEEDIVKEEPEEIFDRFWEILEPSVDDDVYNALAACEIIAAVRGNASDFLSPLILKWAETAGDCFNEQLARNAYNFVASFASSDKKLSEYVADLKSRL